METSLFEEIIADSFPYKRRNLGIKFTKSYFQTNLIQKYLRYIKTTVQRNERYRKKKLKTREKHITYEETFAGYQQISQQRFLSRPERGGMILLEALKEKSTDQEYFTWRSYSSEMK